MKIKVERSEYGDQSMGIRVWESEYGDPIPSMGMKKEREIKSGDNTVGLISRELTEIARAVNKEFKKNLA